MKILFVCTGNICRSPTAEGIFRRMLEEAGFGHQVVVDSAGTGDWHVGEPPDTRAQKAAWARGVDLADLRARQVADADYANFDLILAMDRGHLRDLERTRPDDAMSKISLFLDYAPELGVSDLPDPYFGDDAGFETVLDMIETAGRGLLADIRDGRKVP